MTGTTEPIRAAELTMASGSCTLGISPKTVGHHVEHSYAKAGVATRAGATLFAVEHGLLSAGQP